MENSLKRELKISATEFHIIVKYQSIQFRNVMSSVVYVSQLFSVSANNSATVELIKTKYTVNNREWE